MTNEQKIKTYLEAGHYVETIAYSSVVSGEWIVIIHDNFGYFVSNCGQKFWYSHFDNCQLVIIPRKPPYKAWDKVIVLEVARDIDWYDDFSNSKKWMIWKIWTITWMCSDWAYVINGETFFPSWAIAPAFDDDKSTKIQELESQLAQIQKEIELLKK